MIERVAPTIMILLALVWAILVILDTVPALDYDPPAGVVLIAPGLLTIIGTIYGVRRNGKPKKNGF